MGVFNKFKNFVKKNTLISVIFLITTIFFLFQHFANLSWDFAAYVVNARYLFWEGSFFEVYRAPLISLILGPLLIFGKFGEYLFLLLISTLFFYSIFNLSNVLYEKYFYKYNLEKKLFRIFFILLCFNLFVLSQGLFNGTELLAISFFILFLGNFLQNKLSGHYLALAALSRYNFLIFVPFLLFNKNWKKILKNIGLFFSVFFPWLLFNFLKYGNWFTSIFDSYFLNVLSRQSIIQSFHPFQLVPIFNLFLPLFICGLIFFIERIFKKEKIKYLKYEFLFLIVGGIFIYDFLSTPFKVIRYTFNLFLPIAFFAVLGVIFLMSKLKDKEKARKTFVIILVSIFFLGIIGLFLYESGNVGGNKIYSDVQEDLYSRGLEGCMVFSPHWVPLSYYKENSVLLPFGISEAVQKNNVVVIFKGRPTMDDTFVPEDLEKNSILFEREKYFIFGKENLTSEICNPWRGSFNPMIENSCEVVSKKFEGSILKKPLTKFCEIVNLY